MGFLIDYSWSHPAPRAIADAGYEGVLRYLSNDASKNISPAEVKALQNAGLSITLNWETFETRAIAGGHAGGYLDAQKADALADAVGYPLHCAIYYSCDTHAVVEQVQAYYNGVKAASRRPVGVYGGSTIGDPLVANGTCAYFWQANAGSWSGQPSWSAMALHPSPNASLLQHTHDHTPYQIAGVPNTSFDANSTLRPHWGQWGEGENDLSALAETQIQALYDVVFGGKKPANGSTMIHDIEGIAQATLDRTKKVPTAAQIATAVVAALPPAQVGNVNVQAVATAVVDEFHARLSA